MAAQMAGHIAGHKEKSTRTPWCADHKQNGAAPRHSLVPRRLHASAVARLRRSMAPGGRPTADARAAACGGVSAARKEARKCAVAEEPAECRGVPPRNADTNRHGRCRPPTAPASTELPSTTEEAACLKATLRERQGGAARRPVAGRDAAAMAPPAARRSSPAPPPSAARVFSATMAAEHAVGGPSNHRSPFILNWELVQAGPHPTPRECPQTPPRPPLLARLVTRSYWMPQRERGNPLSLRKRRTKLLGNFQTKVHCKAS